MRSSFNRKVVLPLLYGVVITLGMVVINLRNMTISIPEWVVLYTLAGLLLLVERFSIPISEDEGFSLVTTYLVGFSFAYSIKIVIWSGLAYAVISSVRYKKRWYIQLINASGLTICVLLAHMAYDHFNTINSVNNGIHVIGTLAFAIVYFSANIAFVMFYFFLEQGPRAFGVLRQLLTLQTIIVYIVTVVIGLLLDMVLRDAGLSGAILFTGLILLVAYSYRDYFKMATHFKELAVKDELTGLYNHRWIQTEMDELVEAKQPFSLLMLDIDHFKRYNEILGHVQGDEALRHIANVMMAERLPDEKVSRYSGEEFAVILPDYDLVQAEVKAERLRKAIEESKFPGAERLPGQKLTVSIGVAHFPDMAETKQDLLVKVDDALYKGKFTGRNKVSIYMSVFDEMKDQLKMDEVDQEIIKTIKVFLAILNSKDRYTYAHTERDVRYAEALAKHIGLDEERTRYLRFGSFLHDIGKVEVPIEVLTKRGPLTREEWVIMKNHVLIGENIAKQVPSLAPCLPIIRHHHERFDGTGYPDGLKGYEIPIEARILTIADSFDAMTTSRPYQRKRTMEEAFTELRFCSGHQFDADLVEPFITAVQEIGLLAEGTEEEELA